MVQGLRQELKPWITIWYRPRQTVRGFLDGELNPRLGLVLFLYILVQGYRIYRGDSTWDYQIKWGLPEFGSTMYDMMFIGAFSFLWVNFEVGAASYLYGWLARLLGGKGNVIETRMAYLWAKVPYIVIFFLGVIAELANHGKKIFVRLNWETPAQTPWWGWVLFVGTVVYFIWRLIIFSNGLAEINRFPVWKAVLVWALPLAALGAIVGVIHLFRVT